MKRTIVNLLLILTAVAFAVGCVEAGLRVYCKYLITSKQSNRYLWSSVDVFNRYFTMERRAGIYVSRKRNTKKVSFPVHKGDAERRIFVIGESVAGCYEADKLVGAFTKAMPEYEWNAIIAGVGGYESFPILLVMDEIVNYGPDLIILMMGNNYGTFGGMTAQHWAYRHDYTLSSWTLRLVLAALHRPKLGAVDEEEAAFRSNLESIIDRAARAGVPLVACTLPQNRRNLYRDERTDLNYADRRFFDMWWRLQAAPAAVDHYRSTLTGGRRPLSTFLLPILADAYERTGQDDEAHDLIRRNLNMRPARQADIIRHVLASGPASAILCDFDRWMMEATDGLAGYEYFFDYCHYWPSVYEIISDEVIRVLCEEAIGRNPVVLGRFPQWRPDQCRETRPVEINASESLALDGRSYLIPMLGVAFISDFEYEENRIHMRAWHSIRPSGIRHMMEFSEEMIRRGGKEQWGILLSIAGEVLRVEGLLDVAIQYLDESLRLNPENTLAYFYRGLCWYDMGRRDECIRDWSALIMARPEFGWLTPEYLDRLRGMDWP